MLISTIQFEIHNAKENIHEEFMIEATEDNYFKVLSHRFTRNIQLLKEFDFDFAKKRNYPVEMIDFSTEIENELDMVDEMVGIF